MPVFKVRKSVDAYVHYVACVEADDPVHAAELAREEEGSFDWEEEMLSQFDARSFVTLDADEEEIEPSRIGDF